MNELAASGAAADTGLERLHPLSPLAGVVTEVNNLFGVLIGGAAGGLWAAGVVAALTVGIQVVGHRVRRWKFDGERVVLHEGWLQRSVRTLDVGRVQQVDLHQNVVHRMLGLAEVRIESASGASGADIALRSLHEDEAQRLRASILAAREGLEPPAAEEGPPITATPAATLATMTTAQGALGGLASGTRLLGALSLALVLLPTADRALGDLTATLGAALLVLGTVAYAAGSGAVQYGELTLQLGEHDVAARYGLLNKRDESTPRHRVQSIGLGESLVHRWLHTAEVRIRAAGAAGSQAGVTRLTAPFVARDEAIDVLAALWPDAIDIGPMQPAPPAARRRARFRWAAAGSVAAAAVSVVAASADVPLLLVSWGLLPGGVWFGDLVYRGFGHVHGNGYVVVREGVLRRRTNVVPATKAQTVRVRSTPFQRRWGLADLKVDVAGSKSVTARELGRERADELAAAISAAARLPAASPGSSAR